MPQLQASGDWQLHHDNTPVHASCPAQRFFEKHQITQVTQPRFGGLKLLTFPKTKITFEKKRFQTIDGIQENTARQLMVIGRTVWSPKVLTLKGTEASLSYVQLSLVSCIFFNKCLFFIVHGWVPSGQSSYIIFIIKIFASENLKEQFKISGNWNNSKKWETKLSDNI